MEKSAKSYEQTTLRIPSQLRKQLEQQAAQERRPLASMIRIAIEDGLAQRVASEARAA
jgi:predicted DNA-binding protein